jgi:hypothetical protein
VRINDATHVSPPPTFPVTKWHLRRFSLSCESIVRLLSDRLTATRIATQHRDHLGQSGGVGGMRPCRNYAPLSTSLEADMLRLRCVYAPMFSDAGAKSEGGAGL